METAARAVLLFFMYAFTGWCAEVVFAAVNSGKFVNRGFLNGPICPIYGFGVLLVAYCLQGVLSQPVLLFFASMVLTSAIEFAAGFLAQKLLHLRLWDYSTQPFNIGGYVCLKFSILWGLACVFVLRLVHPAFTALANWAALPLVLVLDGVFLCTLLTDFILTVIQAAKLPVRLAAMEELEQGIHGISDSIGEGIYRHVDSALERNAALKEKLTRQGEELAQKYARQAEELAQKRLRLTQLAQQRNPIHNRLLQAFPHLQQNHSSAAGQIHQAYLQRKGRNAAQTPGNADSDKGEKADGV